MESIENIIVTPIKDLASQVGLGADLMLAIFGMALVVVLFALSLIFKGQSALKVFTKKLDSVTAFLQASDEITEENVEPFNAKLQTMPESVIRGWGFFLEQKVGYPSDYITSRDVLSDQKLNTKNRAGRTFFRIASAIVIISTIWCEYVIGKGASLATVGLSDFTADFTLVASIIAALCAPLLIYIILSAVLGVLYNKQYLKLESAFASFQNALDAKVIIYTEEEDEFITENIGEINAEIEEIISDKLDNKEIIEIVTAPKAEPEEIIESVEPPAPEEIEIAEEPIAESVPEEVAQEEAAVEEVAQEEEMTIALEEDTLEAAQEREQRLAALITFIDTVVYEDPNITKEEVEQLALILHEEMQSPYRDSEDRAIIENSMYKLAARHAMLSKNDK